MTAPELKQGPGENRPPQPPFTVVGAKLDGVTPGFRMRDVNNRLYFVKPDPLSNAEMATASDAIGSRFFYALGYNTPENYLIQIRPDQIKIGKDATRVGDSGKPRPMSMKDIEAILWKMPRTGDGTYRMLASLAVDGKPLGPFRYEKARTDDPSDLVPHEQRRDLRGLFVFCAWLNHTDAKSINSLDALVESNGVKFVRHYLIDFGALFGSDSDMPKNARFGNAYVIPTQKEVHEEIVLNFSAYPNQKRWRLDHPDSNIDHRRVPNLMVFFQRKGETLPITNRATDYAPGDLVTWDLGRGIPHIGSVVDEKAGWSDRYMAVHNIGAGPKMEDVLFAWKITGHYRYFGPASSH